MTTELSERTWDNPNAARRWLSRNPADGHEVVFDQQRSVYCVRPKSDPAAQPEPERAPEKRKPAPAKRKAAKGTGKAPPPARASAGKGPSGKRAEVVRLASRKGGVSAMELVEATTWKKCPWKWTFHNPKGTGLAQKHGYEFRVEKTAAGETRYYLTKPKPQAAASA